MLRFIYCLIFISATIQMNAQENGIKVNPLALLSGDIDAYYERSIGDQRSILVGATLSSIKFDAVRYTGFALLGEYRLYQDIGAFKSEVFSGFYYGPFVRLRYSTSELGGGYSFFNAGGMAGYQWTIKERFLIDAFIGPYYNVILSSDDRYNTDAVKYFGRYSTRIGVSVGILL